MSFFIVSYFESYSGSITSVGEESANVSAFLLGVVLSSSWCLGYVVFSSPEPKAHR